MNNESNESSLPATLRPYYKDEYLVSSCPTCGVNPGEECRAKGGRKPTFAHTARPTQSYITEKKAAVDRLLGVSLEDIITLWKREHPNTTQEAIEALRYGWKEGLLATINQMAGRP